MMEKPQLVQTTELRNGGFYSPLRVMSLKIRWPWKLDQGHLNHVNSSYCHNDTMHTVKLEFIFQFKIYRTKALFGQQLTFQRSPKSDQFFPAT